ncbi:MAG: hypothetical protein SPI34_07785 [Opitutales bacterium]|nr:hypothetical protein [Opitutales bacterium]
MRIFAILNAVFAVVVAYTSIVQVIDMQNSAIFPMHGFNMPLFIITLFLFMACAVVILILERGIAVLALYLLGCLANMLFSAKNESR